MGDIKLFKINNNVEEISGVSVELEKSLQILIENNLETFFGIKFIATEYTTGKNHNGRIDSLGIDENFCPVIIEYKRAVNENVINQGLYYLDWLLDHKAEFKLLVMEKLGKETADKIEWGATRLLCIAWDFTKYDEYAVKQINRNIELIRYKKYGNELLLFELVNATSVSNIETIRDDKSQINSYKTVSQYIESSNDILRDRYNKIRDYIISLGDDVQEKVLKYYIAYKRIQNFVCLEVHTKTGNILLYLKINPDEIQLEEGFSRDVRSIGHFGTGGLEVTVRNDVDFEKAKNLILKSYEIS